MPISTTAAADRNNIFVRDTMMSPRIRRAAR
jgi:hypothetical protein